MKCSSRKQKLLEEEVLEGKNNLVRVRNTIAETDQQMAEAQGLAGTELLKKWRKVD